MGQDLPKPESSAACEEPPMQDLVEDILKWGREINAKFEESQQGAPGWLAFFGRQEGIVDLAAAKRRSGNAWRTASRYHIGRDIWEDYEIDSDRVLGRGMTGDVQLCQCRSDPRRQYAVKCFSKNVGDLKESQYELLRTEAEVYLILDHPNIARLQDVYEDDRSIHLVMEYCSGGELFQRLQRRATYSEEEAAECTRQMLLAVSYLHSHNVVHRDLKLENFLYQSEETGAPLKLIDFGFAKYWDSETDVMQAKCGSINYVSPDVLSGRGYTSQCDCWGLGVIVFMLLSGYPPFQGSERELIKRIQRGIPEWREPRWARVSPLARDFVKRLLDKNPSSRATAREALDHPWLQKNATPAASGYLSSSSLRSLHSYVEAPRLRRAALQLVAQEMPEECVDELRESFLALDSEREGSVRLPSLKHAIRSIPRNGIGTRPDSRNNLIADPESPSFGNRGSRSPTGARTPASMMRRAPSSDILNLFDSLDANQDGRVDYTDWLAATMGSRVPIDSEACENAVHAAFRRFDLNRCGYIRSDDLRYVLGQGESDDLDDILREAGVHNDYIDYDQFSGIVRGQLMTSPRSPKASRQGRKESKDTPVGEENFLNDMIELLFPKRDL